MKRRIRLPTPFSALRFLNDIRSSSILHGPGVLVACFWPVTPPPYSFSLRGGAEVGRDDRFEPVGTRPLPSSHDSPLARFGPPWGRTKSHQIGPAFGPACSVFIQPGHTPSIQEIRLRWEITCDAKTARSAGFGLVRTPFSMARLPRAFL